MKRIKYIIRKRALGDVLWIEPVVRALAEKQEKLIVYTKYPELFEHYPYPNVTFKKELNFLEKVIIEIEEKLKTHFFSINLNKTYESAPKMHVLHAYQKEAGLPIKNEYPKIYLSAKEKALRPYPEDYIVLHLETLTEKNYRKVYGVDWNLLVHFLQSQNIKVIQIGVNCEPLKNTTVAKTTIRELITLIYHSKLFIGLDSGPSHIAASLGIPSVIFFGAVNPAYRHFAELFKGVIMQEKCEFNGCYHEAVLDIKGPVCKLVGDNGIPKCSVHSTLSVISNVQNLLSLN